MRKAFGTIVSEKCKFVLAPTSGGCFTVFRALSNRVVVFGIRVVPQMKYCNAL